MNITAYDLAQRFVGIREIPGAKSNDQILAMLRLDQAWPAGDDVPWCSAFVNYIAWLLRLPRSKSLAANSWLDVGTPVVIYDAAPGFDVVIVTRSGGHHVGFYSSVVGDKVYLLGGNQADSVCVAGFAVKDVVGVRRLYA